MASVRAMLSECENPKASHGYFGPSDHFAVCPIANEMGVHVNRLCVCHIGQVFHVAAGHQHLSPWLVKHVELGAHGVFRILNYSLQILLCGKFRTGIVASIINCVYSVAATATVTVTESHAVE